MFQKILVTLGIAVSLCCGEAFAMADDKLLALKRVNSITEKLLVIAQQRQSISKKGKESFDDSSIRKIVQAQSDIDDLSRLAAVSYFYASPGRAEDHVVDDVFDVTWTLCISRIEKIGGKKAMKALEDIPMDYRVDGAYSLDIREALDRLKARSESK